jgi:hypothetical protein
MAARWRCTDCALPRLRHRLRGHEETIGERLVRDLVAFHDLPPAPYDACEKKAGRVSSQFAGALSPKPASLPRTRAIGGTSCPRASTLLFKVAS